MQDFPREESKTFAENNVHAKLISQLSPHQYKFTEYFEEQGISRSLIHQNTSQVYYQYEGKKYLGVAMSTHSGGFEILNEGISYKRFIGRTGQAISVSSDNSYYNPYDIPLEEIVEVWQYASGIFPEDFEPENFENYNLKDLIFQLRKDVQKLDSKVSDKIIKSMKKGI